MNLPGAPRPIWMLPCGASGSFYVVLTVPVTPIFLELNKKILVRAKEFDYKKQSSQKIAIIS
jgi:hypothetical protein